VIKTIALTGEGVDELLKAIEEHRNILKQENSKGKGGKE